MHSERKEGLKDSEKCYLIVNRLQEEEHRMAKRIGIISDTHGLLRPEVI